MSCHPEGRHSEGGFGVGARGIPRLVLLAVAVAVAASGAPPANLRLDLNAPLAVVRPLQAVTLTALGPGTVSVLDGAGREYVRVGATGRIRFTVGGTAGGQMRNRSQSRHYGS